MSNTNVPMFTAAVKTAAAVSSAGSAWTPSSSTTTNLISLVTAGSNGSRVTSLILSTTDTSANNVYLVLNAGGAGGVLSIIGQVNVPIGAGTVASTLSVDALLSTTVVGLPIDNNGKRYIHMQASDVLYFGTIASVTSGKILFATAMYENY